MNLAITLMLLLFFLSLANACTISPQTTTGTTGQAISFTITKQESENTFTATCENGGSSTSLGRATSFICTYQTTGTKTITVTAASVEGGASQCTATATISLASGNPTVSISSPYTADIISSGSPYTISGSANDSDGTVARVDVQIGGLCGDGATWFQATGTKSWSYSWTPPASKENCVIRARATDNSNSQTTASVTFSTSSAGSGSCTQSCSNKLKTMCPGGAFQPVQCCSASDCTATCVDGQYKAPTCSEANTCSYAVSTYVAGKCGYNPTCSITPEQAALNAPTTMTINYEGFTHGEPGSVTLNCGNGQTSSTQCNGATGECTATCTYTSAGTFTPLASMQGATCTTRSITLTRGQANTTSGNGATNNVAGQPTARGVSCSIEFQETAKSGDGVPVKIKYAGVLLPPGLITISCGNGRGATAPGCTSNVLGNGECSATCLFDAVGQYTPTALVQGANCTTSRITISQAQTTPPLAIGQTDANITISNFATTPSIILEDVETKIATLVKSDVPVSSVQCEPVENRQSTCTCTLASATSTSTLMECTVKPPVRGKYRITLTAADGKIKTAEVTLTPGQAGKIDVINKGLDYTFYAAVAAALLLLIYGAYYAYNKIQEKLTYKERLYKRRETLLKDVEYAKVGYMKGQINQQQFQKIYNAKQVELTSVRTKIAEAEKKAT